MLAYNPQLALDAIWELVTRANKYVEETAPWTLSKVARDGDESAAAALERVLYTLAEAVRIIGILLEPFIPDTSQRIRRQLGLPPQIAATWGESLRWGQIPTGTKVASPEPLFPRLERAV
jgi:methionyl-tRNA synthetase